MSEIDIRLAEREKLTLSQSQCGPASEDRFPIFGNLRQHFAELLRRERLVDALRNLAPLDGVDRVVAGPATGLLRHRENGPQLRAQVVQRRGRCAGGGTLVEQFVEMVRPETRERNRTDVSADDVLFQARRRATVDARLRAALLEPPRAELTQVAGQLLGTHFEPSALQPGLALQLRRYLQRLRLGASRDFLARPPAIDSFEDGPPAVAVPFDLRHGYRSP